MKVSSLAIPEPKHAFDLKAMRQMARRVNSLSHLEVTSGPSHRFFIGDSKSVLQVDNKRETQFHPFKIYNVPRDKAVNPSNAWRSYRVRDGLIWARSKYYSSNSSYSGYPNYELLEVSGTDNVVGNLISAGVAIRAIPSPDDWNYQQDTILPSVSGTGWNAGYTAIELATNDTPYSAPDYVNAEFVLGEQDVTGYLPQVIGASIWISVTDSPTDGLFAILKAQQVTTEAGNAFPGPADDERIIPLGFIWNERAGLGVVQVSPNIKGATLSTQQYLYDHVRPSEAGYCNGVGTSGSSLFYRGDWDNDGLAGQWFYPGDVVSQYVDPMTYLKASAMNRPIITWLKQSWVWNATFANQVNASPFDDSSYWEQLSGFFL